MNARLTNHQQEVYDRLLLRARRREGGYAWVPLRAIGSVGALNKLVDKGYAERTVRIGPRGGEHFDYRPIPQRYAWVGARRGIVESYLPRNYQVLLSLGNAVVIGGRDSAGWTLDDYVIPRLASGPYVAKELSTEGSI